MLNHETFQLSGEQKKKQTEQGAEDDRTQDEKDRAEREYIRRRLAEIAKWEKRISGK